MRRFLFILSLLASLIVSGQTYLFKNYSFDKGHYKIIGLSNQLWPNDIQSKLGEFYIQDISLLNDIKRTWFITQPRTIAGHKEDHFYHYQIAVLKDGKVVESFAINLDSSVILTKSGSYLFDINKLKALIGKAKLLVRKEHKFTSYTSGKAFEADIQKNPDFLLASEWDWENYEGSFTFYYNSEDKIDEVISRLNKFISSTYPKEPFKIDIFMAAPHGELGFKLTCNKSLYDQFKLKKNNWKPLDFYLTTYWKQ